MHAGQRGKNRRGRVLESDFVSAEIFRAGTPFHTGPVAQLAEQKPFKLLVLGSSPSRLTKFNLVWVQLDFFNLGHRDRYSCV